MPLSQAQKAKLSRSLQRIAAKIDAMLAKEAGTKMAFSLVVWGQMGEDNMVQYVANCEREEVIKYMEALLAGWKKGMPDVPVHERH
jgi:hypothetical protein